MKKILLVFLIFSAKTIFSQAPDKNYEFKITAKYSGDDVLAIGSTLEITEYQGVKWSMPIYGGNFSIDGETTGFSKSGNDITVNFNLPRNLYGHSGTMRINLSAKIIQFFEPSIDYSARQRKGTYYFEEIIELPIASNFKLSKDVEDNLRKEKEEAFKKNEEKTKQIIRDALKNKEYFKAKTLYIMDLKIKDPTLLNEIDKFYLPLKKEIDYLYQEYLKEFKTEQKRYLENPEVFVQKFKNEIKEEFTEINGFDEFNKIILNTKDVKLKSKYERQLKYSSFIYKKNDGKHYLSPTSINGNYTTGIFESENLVIKVNYDTTINNYASAISFNSKDSLNLDGVILNSNTYKTKYYLFPFSATLKNHLDDITVQLGENKIYPSKKIHIGFEEKVEMKSLKEILQPKEGEKNIDYDNLKTNFKVLNDDLLKYTNKEETSIASGNTFYNPSLLYLLKKMYPMADTLIFTPGSYKKELGSLALHLEFWNDNEKQNGSIIPLQKGVIEQKENKVIVYKSNGNYSECEIKLVKESVFPLNDINLSDIKIDSAWFINPSLPLLYYQNRRLTFNQSAILDPIIGLFVKNGIQYRDYFSSENVFFQTIKSYKYSPYGCKFEVSLKGYNEFEDKIINCSMSYFNKINDYFELKKAGKDKQADKVLIKAEKDLNQFKSWYFYYYSYSN